MDRGKSIYNLLLELPLYILLGNNILQQELKKRSLPPMASSLSFIALLFSCFWRFSTPFVSTYHIILHDSSYFLSLSGGLSGRQMTTPTHRHSQLNNLSPTLHQNHGENHGDRFLIEQVHIKQPVPHDCDCLFSRFTYPRLQDKSYLHFYESFIHLTITQNVQ